MNETTHNVVPAPFDTLHAEVLGGADRAMYGDQLINRVGDQLAQEFGRGFDAKNLPPLKTEPARQFYASRTNRHLSASSCAPNPAANRWSRCNCTKTASLWPNTGPNCHPKRSWSKSCMPLCLKRVSGWRDVGSCGGTWMTSDETLPRPAAMRRSPGDFDPTSGTINVMTMKVSKGLEFPVVALPGVGYMPANGEDEKEAARVICVAAPRATQRLVIGVTGQGLFRSRIPGHLETQDKEAMP